MQFDPFVENRVRLPTEDLDRVAEIDQRFGQMARVHALTTDVRFTAVGEVGDRERGVWRQGRSAGRCDGRHKSVRLSLRSYRPVSVTGLQRGVPRVTPS